MRFKPNEEDGVMDAASIMNIKVFKDSTEIDDVFFRDNKELFGEEFDSVTDIIKKAGSQNVGWITTAHGKNWLEYVARIYLRKHTPETEKLDYALVETQNVSLGDLYVDSSLGGKFLSGSCNFYQWGKFGGITTPLP